MGNWIFETKTHGRGLSMRLAELTWTLSIERSARTKSLGCSNVLKEDKGDEASRGGGVEQ